MDKKKRVQAHIAAKGETEAAVMRTQSQNEVFSDVLGSYTGTPVDGDVPEQDSDDI